VLDLLILLWVGGVVTGEVKVTESGTRSGHDLLKLLLSLVPEAMLLLVVAFVVVVPLSVVGLILLGAVGDKVGGVTALEATPKWSPHLLVKLVQGAELSRQHDDLIIKDALVLLIRSYRQRGQNKLQSRWDSGVGGVSIMATNTSTSNKRLTSKRSIMVRTTLSRQFMRFEFAK
jgi:hypothetical protein